MNAIDTNVLVYFVDEHEPAKQAKATELLERLARKRPKPRSFGRWPSSSSVACDGGSMRVASIEGRPWNT